MNGFLDFVADPKVHDTALVSMAVTSILLALPKPGTKWSWGLLYEVPYNALVGFWSMRTGQKPPDPIMPETPATTKK